MEPFLRHGDHVLTFNWGKPKVGNVIVFMVFGDFFIKRISKILNQEAFVEGDNKKLSSKLKPIKFREIVGKVILKY